MATSPVSAQALRDARSSLRLGERRPSVPLDLADLEKVKSRLAQRELSISHQGWLTKLSRGGLPNWNRRWFILIGGSLYYSRSDAPTDRDLHVFSELMHAQEVVLAPPQAGYSFVFKLRVESETLVFAAPSNEARLNWLGVLEQALGMQPVGAGILHAELRREAETSDALRLRIVSTELADKEAAMQACVAREEALRHEVATLRHALRCKDEQLWQLAATLTAHNVAMPTMGAAAPPAAPPREALWAAPLPEDVAAGSSLLEAAQASVAGPPAADSTVPLESDHGVTVGDLRDGGWACPTGGQASTTPSGSQTAREMSVPQREAAAGRVSRRTIVGAAASLLRTVNSARAPTETSPASSLHCSPHVNRRKPRRWSEPSVATSATVINLSSAAPAHLSLSSAALADHTKLTAARSQRSLSLSHGRPDADVPSGGDHGPSGLAAGVPTASPSDSSVPFSPLIKQGMLTKLSKGGFTANWNRRAFVLIGSSLFYAKDRTTLTAQPKIFAEIGGCEVHPWDDPTTGHSNVLAVSLRSRSNGAGDDAIGKGAELLLLAADTPRDKHAWIDAITRGARMPQCPLDHVAPTLALQLYGGCADGTLQGVLQAQPDAGSALGGGESPKVGRADFYRGSQDSFDSELLSPVSRESSMSGNHQWWNPEKWRWMPEVFRNV